MAASAGDRLLISGACEFPVAPANGALPAAPAGHAVDASSGERPKRCPASNATSATSAIAASPHGSAVEKLRGLPPGVLDCALAGVPQRWQNFAPGVRDAPHAPHVAAASVAPQFEQNFPLAGLPHEAQIAAAPAGEGETGEAMERKLHGLCLHVIVYVVDRARRFPRASSWRDSCRASF